MLNRLKKLLLFTIFFSITYLEQVNGQCALITDNYSGQSPNSVCAPVNLLMDVRYKFILPVDPSKVEILYVWNDGTGATLTVPAISQGDTVFTQSQSHIYPPADQCSYTAEAYIIYDGDVCRSSSRQEQTFSAWARDNENGGVIITEPVVAQFCEGEDIVNVTFDDNSTFNCNINVEPDKPNRLTRWVQFIYGTNSIGGDRIPNITIRDPYGNVTQMTDPSGNYLGTTAGPIIEIPVPADGPNQTSWEISAPAGGVAGDIFEITMRNWNMCNPYDRNPFDAIPPSDLTDGDFDPVTTTALIEIITTPPQITNPSLEFCVNNPINLTLSTSGGVVNWYRDAAMNDYIHTGNSFDPTGDPTYIDNSKSGNYSFYVTESIGACQSTPSTVSFEIFDSPSPPSDAGNPKSVCADTITLHGNTPVIGTGIWTTTGSAIIDDPTNPVTFVRNLNPGPNLFRWILSHGPCTSVDEVIITSDLQPAPANAGEDKSFCDNSTVTLNANNPTNNGRGTWKMISGTADFSDIHNAHTTITNLSGGENILVWQIESQSSACITTLDTIRILRDVTPSPSDAGDNKNICEHDTFKLEGNEATDGGEGTWNIVTGTALISLPDQHNALATNLSYGTNRFRWTITSQFGICPGSTSDVIIIRDEAPDPAIAGMDQYLCNSVSSPLGANTPTAGTGNWSVVSNPSSHNPVFNPSTASPNSTVQILAGDEGLYTFAWTIINASCRTSDTVTVDFGLPVPQAYAGNDDTVCGTSYLLNGNSPGPGTGTWRKISGTGGVTFVPGIHSPGASARISNGTEGLYSFEWKLSSGSCPQTFDTVNILYKRTPGVPGIGNIENCGPDEITLHSTIGLNGTTNNWYDNSIGGNLLESGTEYTTPLLISNHSYWVTTYDSVTNCESTRRRVDVLIHPVPGQPVTNDKVNCGPASVILNATIGTNGNVNRWYQSFTDSALLLQAKNFTTGILNSSQTFWVSSYDTTTGCEGIRVPAEVTIHPVPSQPEAQNEARCGEGTLTFNTSSGTNGTKNIWYTNSIGGTAFDSAFTVTTSYLISTTNYYVTSFNDSTRCESPRKLVKAIINPIPGFPEANNISHCGPDTVILLSTPGTDGNTSRWYDSLTGGNLLDETNHFRTDYLLATKKYYVSSYNTISKCESSRKEVEAIILPIPVMNPIQGSGQVGQGQTNVIYSVNYHPGSTYIWTIPPGINLLIENENFVILEFPNLGPYNISVQETNSIGCPGPIMTKPILVREDLLYINLNLTQGNICVGENLQIAAIPSGGTPSYSFSWTGDSYLLSATDISNPVFNSNNPGNYHLFLSVMDINLNVIHDTIDLVVFPNPVTSVNVPDSVVCAGEDLYIRTVSSGGSGVYTSSLWTGDISPLSSVTNPNPKFTTLTKGFYNLKFKIEDSNGCSAKDSATIFNDVPKASFYSDAQPKCSPVEFNFINTSEDATEYTWYFGYGDSTNSINSSHLFYNHTSSIQYFNVVLKAVSKNGCRHTSNEYVTVYPNPEAKIDVFPAEGCHPADIRMNSAPGGFSYSWEFGDGSSEEGGYNTVHQFKNTGDKDSTYHIRLIATSFFNCYDTAYSQIIVHPSPVASFEATPLSQMYPERTVYITNTTFGEGWDYKWYYGDKTISFVKDPEQHKYPDVDDYVLSLVVKGEYCSDSTSVIIEILPHPPVAQFKPVEPGCVPLTIRFENTSSYSASYLWEFGDGAISNKPNPEYTYYEPGVYKIKLTATGAGGLKNTFSTINDVYVLPQSFFDIAPRYVYVNEQPVHFFNLSDNGSIFEWDFGDGTTSNEFNPKHTYTKEGIYDVTLSVWTENECFDLYVMENAVLVQPSGKLVFPNAFRPESPLEENRVFKPGILDQVDKYHLMIFNRWGELIFESFDREIGWDGYVNGKLAKQDVYVWKVDGRYTNGQSYTDSGDVTLLR